MGPFSFLNGAFLAALAAAALPVLIHLLSRRRAREVPFAQLRFLDEITRRKVRRMRLQQWLLLALRTLAIAFLALTLSRPVWQGPGGARHRGSSTVAILIDDSYSLETRLDPQALLPVGGEGASLDQPQRYTEARRRAREVTDLLTEGDRAILIFAGSPLRVPYESTVRDAALLTEELARGGTRPVRADLAGALERVYPLLASAKTINREIFIISDFQKNQAEELLHELSARAQTGKPDGGGARAGEADVREASTGDSANAPTDRPRLPIPAGTRVYRVPVAAETTPNVAITGATYEANPDAPGGRLTVRLQNHSDAAAPELIIQALEGDERGRLLADGFVALEPQAFGQTVLTLTETPAAGRLAVRAAADALARDDLRYVSTTAASRVRVLVVTGGALDEEAVAAETRLPLLALDPWREAGRPASAESPLFDVQTIPEADLGLAGRIDADVVLLLNVGRLSAAGGELLERFRTEGGGIFVALGDRVDSRLYNTQVLPRLGTSRLENVEGDTDPATHFTLRPAVTGHEIFEGFPITPGGTLTGAQFQHIVGVRPGAQARVLAVFSGEQPALIEEPGVLIFASSLDLAWSDFPTSGAYLPFLHRALLYLSRGGRASRGDLLVGQRLSVPLPPEGGGERYRFVGPAGLEVPQSITQTERGPLLVSEPVAEPGFYALRRDGGADGDAGRAGAADAGATLQTFAVNVDTRESALAPMTVEEGELLYGSESVVIAPTGEIGRQVLETRYGRELWRLCLAIAFGLLVLESFVSRGRVLA